jgi:hypothetical protein
MVSKLSSRSKKMAQQRTLQITRELLDHPKEITKFEHLFEDAKRRNEHQVHILSQAKDKDCTFNPNRECTYKFKFRRGSIKHEPWYHR